MNGSQRKKQPVEGAKSSDNPKVANSGQKNMFSGIKIDNDPLEREIYVRCPSCHHKVFDSGLDKELW